MAPAAPTLYASLHFTSLFFSSRQIGARAPNPYLLASLPPPCLSDRPIVLDTRPLNIATNVCPILGPSRTNVQMSPAGQGAGRPIYPGRGHPTVGAAPSNFVGLSHHAQQAQQQGQQSPIPPRPPRPGDPSGLGLDTGSWAAGGGEGSWGSRSSPLHTLHQHLPTPPRSMGGRGVGSWDDRGSLAGPDIMGSIHEGKASPDV